MHENTQIGHVHLKVSNLERSIAFYVDVLGFDLMTKIGNSAAFLSAGGYHHHIGLNTWESHNGPQPGPRATGLYHFAILVPSRKELARSIKRLAEHNWPLEGSADHGVSEAIYLRDPDNNGIEIYVDRPKEEWGRDENGELAMVTAQLDMEGIMKEL